MSGKISKSDLPIDYRPASEQVEAMWSGPKTQHFAPGTRVAMGGRSGEILSGLTCKCKYSDKALLIQWDDGSKSVEVPFALNPNGVHHGRSER